MQPTVYKLMRHVNIQLNWIRLAYRLTVTNYINVQCCHLDHNVCNVTFLHCLHYTQNFCTNTTLRKHAAIYITYLSERYIKLVIGKELWNNRISNN
jgi:hypothetical protein